MTTGLIDRVLNGYRAADTSSMLLEELRTENARLNARLSRMAADLSQNRLETDKLRRVARRQKPSYSWLVERAMLDAKGLYTMQCSGLQPSRRGAASTLGMGERRWAWARALAMFAGVHDGTLFTDVDPRQLIQRLSEAGAYAEIHPATLRRFKAR